MLPAGKGRSRSPQANPWTRFRPGASGLALGLLVWLPIMTRGWNSMDAGISGVLALPFLQCLL